MSDTPTLKELIDSAIISRLLQVNICMPAIIEKYDSEDRKADVQPVLNRLLDDDTTEPFPIIPNVPVQMPGGKKSTISFPLKSGDTVLLVVSLKSMDAWLSSTTGKRVDPRDTRRNNLQDAVAIPGVYPFPLSPGKQLDDSDVDLIIASNIGESNETKVMLKENGEIHLGDNGEFIAREGDPVQVTIPMGTFLISASGGVSNPADVIVDGTITGGSSNNKSN
jgi:hypothetical protein